MLLTCIQASGSGAACCRACDLPRGEKMCRRRTTRPVVVAHPGQRMAEGFLGFVRRGQLLSLSTVRPWANTFPFSLNEARLQPTTSAAVVRLGTSLSLHAIGTSPKTFPFSLNWAWLQPTESMAVVRLGTSLSARPPRPRPKTFRVSLNEASQRATTSTVVVRQAHSLSSPGLTRKRQHSRRSYDEASSCRLPAPGRARRLSRIRATAKWLMPGRMAYKDSSASSKASSSWWT